MRGRAPGIVAAFQRLRIVNRQDRGNTQGNVGTAFSGDGVFPPAIHDRVAWDGVVPRAQKSVAAKLRWQGGFDKVQEEVVELQTELAAPKIEADKVASELGDLLFTVVNLARHLHVDPEFALRETNAKFRRRFAAMEATSAEPLEELPAESLEKLWDAAKVQERGQK